MTATLRGRLVLAMVVIAVLSVGIAGLVTRRQAARQVETLVEQTIDDDAFAPLEAPLFDDDLAALPVAVREAAGRADARIIVTREDLTVVADSDPSQPLPELDHLIGDSEVVTDEEVYVLFALGSAGTMATTLAALDRLYVLAAIGGALLAAAAALATSRRLVQPLARLEATVGAIAGGDLQARASGDGPREIAAIGAAVNELAASLDAQIQARRAMTADVAHDLRTPLANVRAYVEGMIDGVAEASGEDLATVHREVLRLQRLVDDLQQLALADAGELQLHTQPVDAKRILAHALRAAAPAASTRGVVLHAVHDDTGCTVTADVDRLLQVLGNLLDNAVRHTPSGGQVVVRCERRADEVRLTVEDEGPGIPREHLPHVFERLHRADPARTGGGAGLGLAIAMSLTRLHGGTLTAANRREGGARFTLTLPPTLDGC